MFVTSSVSARETGKHADERASEFSDREGQGPGTSQIEREEGAPGWPRSGPPVGLSEGEEGRHCWAAATRPGRDQAGVFLFSFLFFSFLFHFLNPSLNRILNANKFKTKALSTK